MLIRKMAIVSTYTEEYSKVDYTASDWYKQGKNIDKELSWSRTICR